MKKEPIWKDMDEKTRNYLNAALEDLIKNVPIMKEETKYYLVAGMYLTTGEMHSIIHVYNAANRLYKKFDALSEQRDAEEDPDPRMASYHEELQVLREEQTALEGMTNGISMVISKNGPYRDWDDVRVSIMDLCFSRNRGHKPELIEQIKDFLF